MCEYQRAKENQMPTLDRETYKQMKGGEQE